MSSMKNHPFLFLLLCFVFLFITFHASHIKSVFSHELSAPKHYTVVIDPGHGGFDSGKVGVNGTLEKDVNLSIAKKLEQLLLASDIKVIMTRTTDTALNATSSNNKKRQDMLQRSQLINNANADCVVSIHQNSYPDSTIDGAQVFYYTQSSDSKHLAALIQQQLISQADPSNHRTEKANDNYYLLKKSASPMVIAECGFLSNPEESKKLVDDTYQQTLAWAIHLGILQYLNTMVSN